MGEDALFGSLQRITAEQLHLNPILATATNSTGGVIGTPRPLEVRTSSAADSPLHEMLAIKIGETKAMCCVDDQV